jgi:ferredoxin
MIVASPKSIPELKSIIADHKKVLFVGCGTCVTVCLAGGEREVSISAYAIRMARKLDRNPVEIAQITIERQCENEFLKDLAEPASKVEAIVSFGCGAGVQAIAERFPDKPVYAGLNTQFLGILEEQAVWTEKCLGCGNCVLTYTGGVCPIARCAKRLFNGPCGGSSKGKCEISAVIGRDVECAWQLIIDRLAALGRMDDYDKIQSLKDWSTETGLGPRTQIQTVEMPSH